MIIIIFSKELKYIKINLAEKFIFIKSSNYVKIEFFRFLIKYANLGHIILYLSK